jgi:DHA1 family bicyclomycin/chloramphenicol resistance-like MFS transporter
MSHPSERSRGWGTTAILIVMVAVGPLSTDLYLPALPAIARDLGATPAEAQLTIGLFIAGFAVMQLVCGPLADRYGRRPVLLVGLVVFALASVLCALATSIETLLAARFLQAVGASVGPVLGRAIVRDLYEPHDAGRILGTMASVMALAPLVAPFLGGWLTVAFGWHANFVALVVMAVLLFLTVLWRLDETLRVPQLDALAPGRMLANYVRLIREPHYLGFALCVAFAFGGLFSWISNSSFVVIEHFGVAPERFGVVFAIVVGGFVVGAYAGSRLTGRLGYHRTVQLGVVAGLVLASLTAICGWTGFGGLPAMTATIALAFLAYGLVLPQATAGALAPFPMIAGTASALMGFTQMVVGFAVNALSSVWFDGTPRPMVTLNLICAAAACAAFFAIARRAPATARATS